jgi:lipopolysaccharide export system protein LptA
MPRARLALLACLLCCAGPVVSVAAGPEYPIEISARDSQYDVGTGVWAFVGEVRIRYGTVEAEGDEGIVQQQDGEFSDIELRGSPATWREVLADGREVTGEAGVIRFDPQREVLVMSGATRVNHPRGVFSGDRLVYDLASRTLAGESEDGGRVRMTIRPPDPEEE